MIRPKCEGRLDQLTSSYKRNPVRYNRGPTAADRSATSERQHIVLRTVEEEGPVWQIHRTDWSTPCPRAPMDRISSLESRREAAGMIKLSRLANMLAVYSREDKAVISAEIVLIEDLNPTPGTRTQSLPPSPIHRTMIHQIGRSLARPPAR